MVGEEDILGERKLLGPQLAQLSIENIDLKKIESNSKYIEELCQ